MKIVIATPLYPPDTAEPAPYVKTLASKLTEGHEVVVVLYGRLPEVVPQVRYVCIDKRPPLPLRLLRYTMTLIIESRHADVLYVENGTSTELPAIIVSFVSRVPIIFHIGDRFAHSLLTKHSVRTYLERFLRHRAFETLEEMPEPRPEILPFTTYPKAAFVAYDAAWAAHLARLITLFDHAQP